MTKEVSGIRPAVILTETGTRLDESRRFGGVVCKVYIATTSLAGWLAMRYLALIEEHLFEN